LRGRCCACQRIGERMQVPIDLPDSSPPVSSAGRGSVDVCCGAWSPDGRDFVFQVTQQGRSDIWWLPGEEPWISRLFRRRPRPVRITAGQLSSLAPAFSPDGRTLFLVGRGMRGELQQFDPRMGQFVRYMDGISAEFVDFSRDGQWVTYVSYPRRYALEESSRRHPTPPAHISASPGYGAEVVARWQADRIFPQSAELPGSI